MIVKTFALYLMCIFLVYMVYDVYSKTPIRELLTSGVKGVKVVVLLIVAAILCAALTFVGNFN